MVNAAANETLLRLSARKLAATLFEGGVDGAAWNEAAQDVADGENAEELVWNLIDGRGLFARDTLHAELVHWLLETAAELQEENDD